LGVVGGAIAEELLLAFPIEVASACGDEEGGEEEEEDFADGEVLWAGGGGGGTGVGVLSGDELRAGALWVGGG
jgi:hypothetical protein